MKKLFAWLAEWVRVMRLDPEEEPDAYCTLCFDECPEGGCGNPERLAWLKSQGLA